MWKEQVLYLLNQVYKYYPVGMSHLRNVHPGYKEMRAIVAKKINQIIEKEETPWSRLIKKLEIEFKLNLLDMGYLQFPCYAARIKIQQDKTDFFNYHKDFVLVISLLCDFYTVYYEDTYQFTNHLPAENPVSFKVIFLKNKDEKEDQEKLFDTLCKIIPVYFNNYGYIHHRILFEHKVTDVFPYSEDITTIKKEFPIYNLLFEDLINIDFNNIKIMD
ncbi:MAG TPA: hypothetical protein VG676_02005 [Chitinophagaceae bacterium]|jgi:hypothetical protein|nr:hypothetical protein [Chitinophagaceae bacterium]